ncbi:MAG: carboxypeptidase regulatory-like domain-containing protein [Elusimicrobia bacterium]|nr:carboxypeptidase regulatory-like domain-containing protein [Elusimicrobiota bacterium]
MARRIISLLIGLGILAGARAASAQNIDVTVTNENGALIQGATVYVVRFGEGGPDATNSRTGLTNASGVASFAGLASGPFEVVAEKHGFFPILKDQFFDPEHLHIEVPGNPTARTVVISSAGVTSGGYIRAQVSNASPNAFLFGSIRNKLATANREVNFGLCLTDGGGTCHMLVSNIPVAGANTYEVDVYDPTLQKGCNSTIATAVVADAVTNAALDINQCGLPPQRIEQEARSSSAGQAANVSVDGVVIDTTSAESFIPWSHVKFEFVNSFCPSTCTIFTNSDNNGRFQLFDLVPGTTYYASIFGNCNQTGCFDGHFSTKAGFGAPPGINDFLYTGTPQIKKVRLNKTPPSIGKLSVYVRDQNGNPVAGAGVNVWPDWDRWEIDGGGGCNPPGQMSRPAMTNSNKRATTGYALVDGLPSGNLSVSMWSQFTDRGIMFNAGADGNWQWGQDHCGSDDLRLTISTDAADVAVGQMIRIYNGQGVDIGGLGVSSITIVVNTQSNQTGRLHGTLSFSENADLRNDPITIVLRGECQQSTGRCNPGNFAVISASGSNSYNYQVFVGSGAIYRMRVESGYWGRTDESHGETEINLVSTAVARLDMNFVPAGRLTGKLLKPDGTVWQPENSGNQFTSASLSASGDNVEGGGWTQVTDAGEYTLGGLIPGTYRMRVYGWGKFPYANPTTNQKATIVANQDTSTDFKLVDGTYMAISVATASLQPISFVTSSREPRPVETWSVLTVPPGTLFKGEKLTELLDAWDNYINYYPPGQGYCGPSGGFCTVRMPSPGIYDMYLLRKGDFMSGDANSTHMFLTILTSSKNVIIDSARATASVFAEGGQPVQAVPVNLTPSPAQNALGQVTLQGTVIANNIFRQADFQNLGGDFDNFMKFIPLISVFDASGSLKSAGFVTPNPQNFTQAMDEQLNQSLANNDWNLFQQTFGGLAFGYQLRGLIPGQTYLAVLTTPNYPPYQTKVTMSVDGSTTTLNFNLDQLVGSGATLSGVVTTTNSVVIANASVAIEAENYPKKIVTTNASGVYSVAGLPPGNFKILASASGYAPSAANKDVFGTGTLTQNLSLTAAAGVISGTVYSQRLPFAKTQPNAEIIAYDDTFNGQNPTSELPLFRVKTSSVGAYRLDNLVPGNTYRIAVKYPGKYVITQSTVAPAAGIDFTLASKPLRVEVTCAPNPPKFQCTVANPGDFDDGQAWYHQATVPFSVAVSTPIMDAQEQVDGSLVLNIPLADLSDNVIYNMHIVANPNSPRPVIQDLRFSKSHGGGAKKDIDDELLGDSDSDAAGRAQNKVTIDDSGNDASAITIPPGSMLPISSGAIPSCSLSNVDVDASTIASIVGTVGRAAFASDVYQLDIASVNFTAKGFQVCLSYDKNQTSLTDAAVHHYNSVSGKWEVVPGQQTLDPIKGTVCARVLGLTSVSGVQSSPMRALFDGRSHRINPLSHVAGHVESGSFGILKPSLTGAAYSGSIFKVFNFPNPFNLSDKTVNLVHGGATTSLTTRGTVIKYEVPSSVGSSRVHIRIYNLAGELVQELDQGEQSGGSYYYAAWDGRQRDGKDVANGVYYGVISMGGVKAKDATFKMAVIK